MVKMEQEEENNVPFHGGIVFWNYIVIRLGTAVE